MKSNISNLTTNAITISPKEIIVQVQPVMVKSVFQRIEMISQRRYLSQYILIPTSLKIRMMKLEHCFKSIWAYFQKIAVI